MTSITLEVTKFISTRRYYEKTSIAIKCEAYHNHNSDSAYRLYKKDSPEGFDTVLSLSVVNLKKFLDVL